MSGSLTSFVDRKARVRAWGRAPVSRRVDVWLLAVGALLFGYLLLSGGLVSDYALAMCVGAALLLAAAMAVPELRRDLVSAPWLWPGLVWLAAMLAVYASLDAPLVVSNEALGDLSRRPGWTPPGAATVDPSSTIVELILMGGLALFFLIGTVAGASADRLFRILVIVVVIGAVFAAWALVDFSLQAHQGERGQRLDAGLHAPNTAATVFGVLAVLAFGLVLRMRQVRGTWRELRWLPLWICGGMFLISALVMTGSRMGLAATAAGLIVTLVAYLGGRRGAMFALAIAGVILVGALLLAAPNARFDMAGVDSQTASRFDIAGAHWRAFYEAPLQGYGLGAFDTVNRKLLTAETFNLFWEVRAAHNVYLQWLEEGGVLAAAPVFATVLLVIGATAVRFSRAKPAPPLIAALIAVDCLVLLHGSVDFALQTPAVAALWSFLLGLQFVALRSRPADRQPVSPLRSWVGGTAVVAVSGVTAAFAVVAVGALSLGGHFPAAGAGMELAAGYDRRAMAGLARGRCDWRAVDDASRQAIRLRPYDVPAWLRIAAADRCRNGTLSPAGGAALAKSYDLMPLDPNIALWRIGFGYENWNVLEPELKSRITHEASVLAYNGVFWPRLRQRLLQTENSAGRIEAAFLVARLNQRRSEISAEKRASVRN